MAENIMLSTLQAIFNYCEVVLDTTQQNEILRYIKSIFDTWPKAWVIIKNSLQEIEFNNKEEVLSSFVKKIPELRIFQDVIHTIIYKHPEFWDIIYINLLKCKSNLNEPSGNNILSLPV